MPIFPFEVTPYGATLEVVVSAPSIYVTRETQPTRWKALVDTGANMSFISPAVVMALRPPQLSYESIGRAGGVRSYAPTYDIRLCFDFHDSPSDPWFALEAAEIQPATPDIDVVIGIDLLLKLELVWHGPTRLGFLAY